MCQPSVARARASATTGRPRWGLLYGAIVSQLTMLAFTEVGWPPSAMRLAVRYVVAIGTFVAMAAWAHASRAAFDLRNWCECASRTMTVRVVESRASHPALVVTSPSRPSPTPALVEEYEVAAR